MIRSFLLVLGLSGIVALTGCSSETVDVAKNQKPSATPAAAANQSVASNAGISPEIRSADANVASADPSSQGSIAQANVLDRKRQMLKGPSGGPAEPIDIDKLAAKNSRPAPENSTFTSFLADIGYEIRAFKSHPKLLKVEKRLHADGSQTAKVFLKDGRVVDMPGQNINPLASATSAYILDRVAEQIQGPTQKQ